MGEEAEAHTEEQAEALEGMRSNFREMVGGIRKSIGRLPTESEVLKVVMASTDEEREEILKEASLKD